MNQRDLGPWQHHHQFSDHSAEERRTYQVIALNATMMVVEIIAGISYNSMALLADGWHMSTHVAAFGIAAMAYRVARRSAGDSRFTFGTGKIAPLGAFASAVLLGVVAVLMAAESVHVMFKPSAIQFNQALVVACLGLAVNVGSAVLLGGGHRHSHSHGGGGHHHGEDRPDLNLRAAYLHVVADAVTSVLAIVALLAAKYVGWQALDPVMGVVGAILVGRWSMGLLRDAGRTLVDADVSQESFEEVRDALEQFPRTQVTDLHLWRIAPGKVGVIAALLTEEPRPPAEYRAALSVHEEYVHVTVEVQTPGSELI